MNQPVNKKNGLDVYVEGWLLKKKSNETTLMFKSHNQRWFRLQEVQGADHKELALVYYQNQKENEAKGWIYMKDVIRIVEEKKTFSIVSPARTMVLEATTAAEHNTWIAELYRSSPQLRRADSSEAKDSGLDRSPSSSAKNDSNEDYTGLSQDGLRKLDAKGNPTQTNGTTIDRSASLFSRHALGEKNSFYNAQGKPTIPISHTESGDSNYREEELIQLHPDLMHSTDSISGLLDREYRQNGKGGGDRDREGHPPRPRTDSRGNNNSHHSSNNNTQRDVDDNASEGSGSAGGTSGRRANTQDDHRKHGYRHGGDVTHRLHRHIAKDANNNTQARRATSDNDNTNYDEQEYQQNHSNQGSRQGSRQNSANEHNPPRRRSHDHYDDNDDRYVHRGDDRDADDYDSRAPTKQQQKPPSVRREKSNEDEDIEDVSLRVRRRPISRQPSRDLSTEDSYNTADRDRRKESNEDGEDDLPRERRNSRSAFTEDGPSSSSSSPRSASTTSNNNRNTGGGGLLNRSLPKPTKKPPPPTTAPPPRRTARDSLAMQDDEDISAGTNNNANLNNTNTGPNSGESTAQARRSIDEVLFKQQLQSHAEDKASVSRHDSSDEEDVDFKTEYVRYADQKGVSPDSTSGKPPKHLGSVSSSSSSPPAPTASPVYSLPNHRNPQQRAGTPPRPNGNAGTSADRNFATENWDDDDNESTSQRKTGRNIDSMADAKHASEGTRNRDAKGGGSGAVTLTMADPNWLEENFDD